MDIPVIVAGHSCVDLLPQARGRLSLRPGELLEIGPLAIRPGGCVVNTGSALAALGLPVRLATAVGDDLLGDQLAGALRSIAKEAQIAVDSRAATSYSLVIEDGGRSRTIWHHVGAAAAFDGVGLDISGARLVHLGYPPALPALLIDHGRPLDDFLHRVHETGATASVDMSVDSHPGARDWNRILARALPSIDVFSPSADDLVSVGWLPPAPTRAQIVAAADRLISAGAGIVMISDGERGAWLAAAAAPRLELGGPVLAPLARAWGGHRDWVVPSTVDRVATTNGAGDTATAGLLFGLLNGDGPRQAGRFAADLAARRIAGVGRASEL